MPPKNVTILVINFWQKHAYFEKYLEKNRSTEPNKQLSLKYVKMFASFIYYYTKRIINPDDTCQGLL